MLSLFPKIELRDYQKDLIQKLYRIIRGGDRRVLVVSPTGSGKTIVGSQIIKDARSKGRKVLFLVHLDALVGQTYDKLQRFGLDDTEVGFIKAGWKENRNAPVQIASLQTISRRQWWKAETFDLLIFDEAHETAFHTAAEKVRQTFDQAFVIGLTATPWRSKRTETLKQHFDQLTHGPTPKELQAMGALAKLKYFGCGEPDLTCVSILGGEYRNDELARACNRPEIIEHVFNQWDVQASGKQTLSFGVDVSHAVAVEAYFSQKGIKTALVVGSTPTKERRVIFDKFAAGEIQFISSVNCVSTGFDSPVAEVGLMLRPTRSPALWHQQIGRIMRPYPGKEHGLILDFSGNIDRHGVPELIAGYDFHEVPKNAGLKKCPECDVWIPANASVCPECGHVFDSPELGDGFKVNVPEIKPLRDITEDLLNQSEIAEKTRRRFYRDKLKSAYYKGYNPDWARHKFKAKYGHLPQPDWAIGAVFAGSVEPLDFRRYAIHLSSIAREKDKPNAWILQHFAAEFGADSLSQYPTDLLLNKENHHDHHTA